MGKKDNSSIEAEPDLVVEALQAYGIGLRHVEALHRVNETFATGRPYVRIKTVGGTTVVFSHGDKVSALTEEQLTGR